MVAAEGEAALFLAETILMLLLDGGLLSQERVSDAMEAAINAKRQEAKEGPHPAVSQAAVGILSKVATSLAALKPTGN